MTVIIYVKEGCPYCKKSFKSFRERILEKM